MHHYYHHHHVILIDAIRSSQTCIWCVTKYFFYIFICFYYILFYYLYYFIIGYILEVGCEKAAQVFLEESPHLKEFAEGIRNGHRYTTLINKKSLIQILNSKNEDINRKNDNKVGIFSKSESLLTNNNENKIENCVTLLHQIKSDLSKIISDKNIFDKYCNLSELNSHNDSLV